MGFNSYTTVATVRQYLGNLFAYDDVIPNINQATERMMNSGIWKGAIGYVAFPSVQNYFSLSYEFLAVIGVQFFRCPVPVFGQYHDFIEGGPGQPIANMPPQGIVRDLGDGYATSSDPVTPYSTLFLKTDLTIDNGKVFRVYGNSNGKQVFDVHGMGMYLTVNTSETTVFDQVTMIEPPLNSDGSSAMIGGYTIYSVSPTGVQTNIGYVYPNQIYPQFRRYQIGVVSATNPQGQNVEDVPNAVTCLVRRRWLPVFKETDPVRPGNLSALKFAMQAIDTEASRNNAQPLWDQCTKALDQELHATRGAVRPEMNYSVLGAGALFDNVY